MLFICYPKCSTCKKARAWLEENNIAFEERDIKTENPTEAELKSFIEKGVPIKKLWNTSGMLYRENNLKDKIPTMTEAEQIAMLATDGMLVKRPILVGDGFVLTGFKEADWAKFCTK